MFNIVNLKREGNIKTWLLDSKNVYMVRPNRVIRYSKWRNQFRLCDGSNRKKVLEFYRRYILSNSNLIETVKELKGKVLGCWCAPYLCHAEVLHLLAGNLPIYKDYKYCNTMEPDENDVFVTPVSTVDDTLALDETLNTKGSTKRQAVYVDKNEPVSDSISSGKFSDVRRFNKRTVQQKRMGSEIFDSPEEPIFQQHKSGF